MAQCLTENNIELSSKDNSNSIQEYLNIEKSCEQFKGTDEEIILIFNEINKISGSSLPQNDGELDDVELILKRAEDLSKETQNILNNAPAIKNNNFQNNVESVNIPVIRVTKAKDVEDEVHIKIKTERINDQCSKHNAKDASKEPRRKSKPRPFSAGIIDTKKKESAKMGRFNTTPKKAMNCKHESLIEELKDTNERVKGIELLNVQLNDDKKCLSKKLNEVAEQKHITDLKLAECEKLITRLSIEYENRSTELKDAKDNENRVLTELSRVRNDRKNLSVQREKDSILIQDLQRQCKEMEMILRRKHPDSVSALIVAAKSSSVEDNKRKLLEERISRLEQELKDKENHFQSILLTLQEKFGDMKQKYENYIIDIERQLMEDRKTNAELKSKVLKFNLAHASTQTIQKSQNTVASQTFMKTSERASSAVISRLPQNSALILNKLKEDSYLVATIKGLQAELTVKQRTIAKINRETEELKKNLRTLQKEKEVLLNLNPHKKSISRQAKSTENILVRVNTEMEAELSEIKKQKEILVQERNTLLDSLKRTNEEFILLKKKRIQDLHTLQLAHEKELMQMNMQVYPLQEEIQLLNRTVEMLQDRVRADDKEIRRETVNGGGDNNAKNTTRNNR